MHYNYQMMGMHSYPYTFSLLYFILHVAVIILVIGLIVRIIRGHRGRRGQMYSLWHANSAISLLAA